MKISYLHALSILPFEFANDDSDIFKISLSTSRISIELMITISFKTSKIEIRDPRTATDGPGRTRKFGFENFARISPYRALVRAGPRFLNFAGPGPIRS